MRFGEMKWPEVRNADKSKIVVLPLASMEQHGHHMPLLTDTILTQGVLEAVEREMAEQVLTLPVLWLGASHHHLDFPGTVSLPSDLYTDLLCEMLDCLIRAGFRKIFLLIGHGGNLVPASAATTRTRIKHGDLDDLFLVSGAYWRVAADEWKTLSQIQSPELNHACEYEASMGLFLRPELMDLTKAVGYGSSLNSQYVDPHGWRADQGVELAVTFRDLSENGAMGRPDLATAEKGKLLVESAARAVVGFLREFATWEHIERTAGPPIP